MRQDYGDPVAEACEQLRGYIPVLERLTGEPSAPPGGGTRRMLARPAFTPMPGGQALRNLMDILEDLCRLEASIRLATSGHPGRRRSLWQHDIDQVLTVLPKLVPGLDEPGRKRAAWYLGWLVRHAQGVRDIDEVRRWRPLPSADDGDGLPPDCPYCGMSWLKVCMDADPGAQAGVVACFNTDCPGDGNGMTATATMGTDEHGVPCLTWGDGKIQAVPGM